MYIRYNDTIKLWEYDTSPGSTGAGPWVKIDIDYSQLINTPNGQNTTEYSFSTAITPPPAKGQVRFENANFSLVTKIWLSTSDTFNNDVYWGLKLTQVGAKIVIQDTTDHNSYVIFKTSSEGIDNADYFEFPVTYEESASSFANNESLLVRIVPPGTSSNIGAHHLTHETGGSDAIQNLSATVLTSGIIPGAVLPTNVALTDITNIFTPIQAFTAGLKERDRAVPIGEWTSFAPIITNSSGGSISGITNVFCGYMLIGLSAFITVNCNFTNTGATPIITILIPSGLLPTQQIVNSARVVVSGASKAGFLYTNVGDNRLAFQVIDGSNFGDGVTYLQGSLTYTTNLLKNNG